MKFLIQRVTQAKVTSEGKTLGEIDRGFLVLIGVSDSDTEAVSDRMIKKMTGLRIFEDEDGKTNKSLSDVSGSLLLVSQFTLYADCRKGNRPSFIRSGAPEHAEALYEYIISECRKTGIPTETGSFGADMQISLINDGPFTILLDSKEMWDI